MSARLAAGDGLDVDDDATVTVTFEGALRAEIRVTWRSAAPAWDAQTASPSGAVRIELVPEPRVELNGGPLPLPVSPLAALGADADAGRQPRCGPAFGRTVLDVVCAAYASAASGRPEPLPFAGPRDRTPLDLWRHPA